MVNIAAEAGNFFQTDAELAKQKEKEAKYNYTIGDCIKLSSKGLALMIVDEGKYAYVAESGFLAKRINLETKKTVKLFKGHHGPVTSLALSNNGAFLWTGSWDKTIKKWDTKKVTNASKHTKDTKPAFTASEFGMMKCGPVLIVLIFELVASADKTVRRWNIETGEVDTILEHPAPAKSVVVAGPYVITGASDDNIRVWDIASGKLEYTIEGHFDEVGGLDVHGSTVFSVSLDCSLRRWSITAPALKKYVEEAKQRKEKKQETEDAVPGLTEEEERELAELMDDSDN
ncbi:hypothetical protein EC973_000332 [Apophysomyces ossiformis]|uniref:Uncharacterized protein n=1 Tax=Apophysomyces ossiformis TaxID=679940 RepID=A0A8H7EQ43_9FUNG|nr:hypothetical protein EC973_000332 [Apophysomyces ossiformis]